jgi:hypothetical protein
MMPNDTAPCFVAACQAWDDLVASYQFSEACLQVPGAPAVWPEFVRRGLTEATRKTLDALITLLGRLEGEAAQGGPDGEQ